MTLRDVCDENWLTCFVCSIRWSIQSVRFNRPEWQPIRTGCASYSKNTSNSETSRKKLLEFFKTESMRKTSDHWLKPSRVSMRNKSKSRLYINKLICLFSIARYFPFYCHLLIALNKEFLILGKGRNERAAMRVYAF